MAEVNDKLCVNKKRNGTISTIVKAVDLCY